MYKNFYKKEIEKISKILEQDDIHIIETWANFQRYIYDVSNERNICTDLVLLLDKNPKHMKVMNLEKIENCMKYSPLMPEYFSLEFKEDGFIKENIDFSFYQYDQENPLISIRVEYKNAKDYDDFDIEIDKDNAPYSKAVMTYANNIIDDLDNEFNVDLSSEKFDLKDNNKIRMESWTKNYESPIFGEYTLRFKIYKENCEYTIEIENSFTNNIYKVEDKFSSYHNAVDWMGHIKDNLIPLNDEDLEENI